MSIDITVIYSFIVALIAFVFLDRSLFRPVGKVLDERKKRLDEDRNQQERATADCEAALLKREESLREARRAAWGERETVMAEAAAEKERRLSEARQIMAAEVEKGKAAVRAAASDAKRFLAGKRDEIGREIAMRILGRAS